MTYIAPNSMRELLPYLSGRMPIDVAGVARSLGIAVFQSALAQNVSGMLIRNDKFSYPLTSSPSLSGWSILVNQSENSRRQRFTIAHEIGHFVMHRHLPEMRDGVIEDSTFYRSNLTGYQETEANRFAADLLMPIELVINAYRLNPNISIIARMFDVSEAAMKVRLEFGTSLAA